VFHDLVSAIALNFEQADRGMGCLALEIKCLAQLLERCLCFIERLLRLLSVDLGK